MTPMGMPPTVIETTIAAARLTQQAATNATPSWVSGLSRKRIWRIWRTTQPAPRKSRAWRPSGPALPRSLMRPMSHDARSPLAGVAGKERGEAGEREEQLGPHAAHRPVLEQREFEGEGGRGEERHLAGAVLDHYFPPPFAGREGRPLVRTSVDGTRSITCSSARKLRTGSTPTRGRGLRADDVPVTRPRMSPRGTPLTGSSVVTTSAPGSAGMSPLYHLSSPFSPAVPE